MEKTSGNEASPQAAEMCGTHNNNSGRIECLLIVFLDYECSWIDALLAYPSFVPELEVPFRE